MKQYSLITLGLLAGTIVFAQPTPLAPSSAGPSTNNGTNTSNQNPLPMPSGPTVPSPTTSTVPSSIAPTQSSNSLNIGSTSQTDITTRVRQDLMNDPAFSGFASGIAIENLNGQITLRGQVPNRTVEQELINRVSRISGISLINNEMTVAPAQSH